MQKFIGKSVWHAVGKKVVTGLLQGGETGKVWIVNLFQVVVGNSLDAVSVFESLGDQLVGHFGGFV